MRCDGLSSGSCKMFRLFIETSREKFSLGPFPIYMWSYMWNKVSNVCTEPRFYLQSWRQEETRAEYCRTRTQSQTFTWGFFQHPTLQYSFNLFSVILINTPFLYDLTGRKGASWGDLQQCIHNRHTKVSVTSTWQEKTLLCQHQPFLGLSSLGNFWCSDMLLTEIVWVA